MPHVTVGRDSLIIEKSLTILQVLTFYNRTRIALIRRIEMNFICFFIIVYQPNPGLLEAPTFGIGVLFFYSITLICESVAVYFFAICVIR